MILLFVFFLSFARIGSAEPSHLIEFRSPPGLLEIESVRRISADAKFERFDSIEDPYFLRLYRIAGLSRAQLAALQNLPWIQNIAAPKPAGTIQAVIPPKLPRLGSGDPFFAYQWGLVVQGQQVLRDIDDLRNERLDAAPDADIGWESSIKDAEAGLTRSPTVAVIDSGVSTDHPDLKPSILRGASGEALGWNFATETPAGEARMTDDLGHGTHVAGIIAATAANGKGIRGVSDKIRILPVRVLRKSDNEGIAMSDRLASGILYATRIGVDVINLSLGWPSKMDTPWLREAIRSAQRRGITVVAAAGNNSHDEPIFPCAYEGVICVGASDIAGKMAPFSNYGAHVDVLAPGDQILSTSPIRISPRFFHISGFEIKSGTSQATPFVSAAVALLKAARPGINEDEIKGRLFASASANGVFKMSKLFAHAPRSWVQPIAKETTAWEVDMSNGEVRSSIDVHNYGVEAASVKIQIRGKGWLKAASAQWIGTIAAGTRLRLPVVGTVDPQTDDRQDLSIEIDGRQFQRSIRLHRKLDPARDLEAIDVQFTGPAVSLSALTTVSDPDRIGTNSTFFLSSDKGLRVFHLFGTKLNEAAQPLTVPNKIGGKISILNIQKVDANFDGKSDLWVSALEETDDKLILLYYFLNEDGTPLWGPKDSLWSYQPEEAVLNTSRPAWLKVQDETHGALPALAFMSSGGIPAASVNPDPWVAPNRSSAPHWYVLVPTRSASGVRVETRILDDWKYRRQMTHRHPPTRPQLDESDWFSLGILPQTSEQRRQGEITALTSIGRDYERFNYRVRFSGLDQWKSETLELGRVHLEGAGLFPDQRDGIALVGFYSDFLARFTHLDSAGNLIQTWTHPSTDPREPLIDFVASFSDTNSSSAIFQSRRFLVAQTRSSDGTETIDRRPIYRFSFLPGKVFSSWFLPLEFAGTPALYVDSSSVTEPIVNLMLLKNGRWSTPIRSQIRIPQGCNALNPRPQADGSVEYLFACDDPTIPLRRMKLK